MAKISFGESGEALFAQMIEHNTVNPAFGGPLDGQAKLLAWLEEWSQARGLKTLRLLVAENLDNLLVIAEGQADLPWLVFDSHLDTVATLGMSIAPHKLTTERGRYYGRGVCDTKGSGAAMLWALVDYAKLPKRRQTVAVLFTVDEESQMTGAKYFLKEHLPSLGCRLRGIVVGEPTQLKPVVATNGVVRWKTRTRGVAAHSSDPSRGSSAISAMVRVIDALESSFVPSVNRTHPLTGKAAASINVIRGGTQVNVIPDECVIECDRRLVPGETIDSALAARDDVLRNNVAVEHEPIFSAPPLDDVASRGFVAPLQLGFERAYLPFVPSGGAYVSNGSFYAEAGIPVLVLGPGDAAQAHTKDEWLEITQFSDAVRLYRELMTS